MTTREFLKVLTLSSNRICHYDAKQNEHFRYNKKTSFAKQFFNYVMRGNSFDFDGYAAALLKYTDDFKITGFNSNAHSVGILFSDASVLSFEQVFDGAYFIAVKTSVNGKTRTVTRFDMEDKRLDYVDLIFYQYVYTPANSNADNADNVGNGAMPVLMVNNNLPLFMQSAEIALKSAKSASVHSNGGNVTLTIDNAFAWTFERSAWQKFMRLYPAARARLARIQARNIADKNPPENPAKELLESFLLSLTVTTVFAACILPLTF